MYKILAYFVTKNNQWYYYLFSSWFRISHTSPALPLLFSLPSLSHSPLSLPSLSHSPPSLPYPFPFRRLTPRRL